MVFTFKGKRALVTGAGKGMGRGLTIKLCDLGAEVIAVSRTQSDLDSLKKENKTIRTICLDIADWEKTKHAIEDVGAVDILVNNAGIMEHKEYGNLSESDVERIFNVNVKPIINISQIVANGMKKRGKGGSIVNVSSMLSKFVFPSSGVYCASKGAVDQLTRSMAAEFGPHKIRVNTVNPTIVRTPLAENTGLFDPSNTVTAEMKKKIPLRRFCEVEDVVWPIIFLLSDKAAMINGITLPIDGGLHTLV